MKRLGLRVHNKIWIDAPLRYKGLVVVAIPLTFLLLSTLLYNRAANQQEEATSMVRHTLKMRDTIHRLQVATVDAETGVRGYLLTGDKSFLKPYDKSRIDVPPLLRDAASQVAGDKDQAQRVKQFTQLYNQQIKLLDEQIRFRGPGIRSSNVFPPREQLLKGKALMDLARQELTTLQREEESKLAKRRDIAAATRGKQRLIIDFCALFGLAGGVVAALLFTTGVIHRMQQLEESAHLLATEEPVLPNAIGADEIGHLGLALEKTSRLLAQRRHDLQESQSRLQALFQNTQDSVLLLDDKARFVDANPSAEQLTGLPHQALTQSSLWDIAPIDLQPELSEKWKELGTLRKLNGEFKVVQKDGRFLDVEVHLVADILTGLHLAVIRDISERKQAIESLKQARAEAERANQAKSEFLSRVSHELRTPLNAILGFAQLMEMDDPPPLYSESIDQILKGGRHLLALINEVLDIARVESAELSLSPEAVSLREVIQEAAELVQPLARAKQISIRILDPETSDTYVMADRQRLKQILLNLLSNAVKYNRQDGKIEISSRPAEDDTVQIDISDTGFGISQEKMEKLFRPFERLGAEQHEIEGTGLGLVLSKGLITAMNGAISVHGNNNGEAGTTVSINLPTAQNPLQELEATSTDVTESIPPIPGNTERKILYIEDNLPNLKVVEYLLARLPGVTLISAMQGRLGIDLAREHKPDLIFLDLHLPDIPGDEVLQRLQQDGRTHDIPVVIISADATQKRVQRLLEAGAKAYITKPLDVKQFLKTLQENLGIK